MSSRRGTQMNSALKAGKVRVVVRCRPPLAYEEGHSTERIFIKDNCVLIHDRAESKEAVQFSFDRVLPPESDQADTFMEAEPLIDHVLDGFHATIFAYGQTGSGKTHTMEGITYVRNSKGAMVPDVENSSSDQHGLLLRSIQLLYDRARARQGGEGTVGDGEEVAKGSTCDEQYTFRCSYLQIYNEKVTDLLNNSTSSKEGRGDGLAIRWCHGDTFKVQNLVKWECESPQSMRDALFRGIKQKVVSSHAMNLQSSRSHCMFTIEVECRNTRTGRVIRTSEFTFVDLAGSEKLGMLAANPSAKMMKESININTSLLALGKVIMALADKKKKRGASHVPYRDSKLTKLLKHSLGGNSFTVMIACINPSDNYIEETTSTLLYAGRAKNIENVPHINEDTNSALIRSLRAEIAQLKKELAYYRSMAAEYVSQTTQDIAPVARAVGEPQTGSATVASSVVPSHKEGQLADSLLTACSMLQQVLEINGKLREAYDAVMEDKEAGEQREVQINAENTALRERVEFLESIALNQNFINKVEQFDEEDDKDTNAESSSEEEEEASSARERPNSTPPVRSTRLAPAPLPPTTGTALFTPSLSGTSARSTAEPVPPLPAATSSRKRKTDKKKSKPKKKKRNLGDKLRDYESRYRGSNVGENYEAYYGDARKSIPKSTKTSNVTKEVATLLQKLPKEIVNEFVPKSAIKTKSFGQLNYCGTPEEVKQLEARKKERENYRDRLLKRQEELRDAIMRDLAISEMGGEVYLQRQAQTMVGQPADPIPPNPYANTYSGGPSSFLNRNRKKGSDSSSEAKNTTTARESTVKESMSSMDRLKQYLNSQ